MAEESRNKKKAKKNNSETDGPDILMVQKIFLDHFTGLSEKYIKGRLVDIGCGTKPYGKLLADLVTDHVGVDHTDTSHDKSNIDIFATAYNIPVKNNSFDSAICTCVLEHLEEPEDAVRECYRVLKHGGYAIYHTPFIWHLHEEPRDFYRFSKYGLKYLFEKCGFEVIEIRPISGFVVTFAQLNLYLMKGKFNHGLIKWLGLFRLYNFICQKLALFLNKYDHSQQYTCEYISVIRK
ncbi:MAG: class I SAM-dependent methyltransferase [Bacteroidales bacterium]|nr:class I SAM-dependent methyltransferase [Bacteroidales bacterium]